MLSKNYLSNIKLKGLKNIAKAYSIPYYYKKKKKDLIEIIVLYKYSKIISKNLKLWFYADRIDPITLEKIEYPCFQYYTKNRKCLYYNYHSLINYLLVSGVFKDPISNEKYSDIYLKKMDHFGKQKKLKSVFKAKYNNKSHYEKIKRRENAINELKSILDIIAGDIFDGLELNNLEDSEMIHNLRRYRKQNRKLQKIDESESKCYEQKYVTKIKLSR